MIDKVSKKNNISLESLASIAHEIRNPLNIIIGLTHLLRATKSDKEKDKYINSLIETSEGLIELVNNIMDFSKVNAGKLKYDYKYVDLKYSIEQNLIGYKTLSKAKGLEWKLEFSEAFPKYVYTDAVKVNQVLTNLLSNSLKFTNQGYIKLAVFTEEINGGFVRVKFEVEDTGKGIPRDKLKDIFEAFHQGTEDINLKFKGTGIGLSICKQVISELGGELKVQSEIDLGSCFTFYLDVPFKNSLEKVPKKTKKKEPYHKSRQKVLIVDDSKLNSLIIKKTLEDQNFETLVVHDGMSAIKILQETLIDLILLDIQMPGIDGVETAEVIKDIPGMRNIPIIAVTGFMESSSMAKGNLQFSEYLLKPFHPKDLIIKALAAIECNN